MYTGLCNHNRIGFTEMSSWTALTWHIGIKTAFYSQKIFSDFYYEYIILRVIEEYLKKYSALKQATYVNHRYTNPNIFDLYIFGLKCCPHL